MSTVSAVIFDFDGVLVESNQVKRQAYFDVFAGTTIRASVIDRCLADLPEGDRFDVIRCVLEQTPEAGPASESRVLAFAEEYGRIAEAGVAASTEVGGASAVLDALAGAYRLAINSATPEDVLGRLVARRGWSRRFQAVLGRPASKLENFRRIAADLDVTPVNCVFVGDRRGDLLAAAAFGCRFVARQSDGSDFTTVPTFTIGDLTGLPGVLDRLEARRVP